MFDEMRNNPFVKKALEAGEQRVGRVVSQLLGNERVMTGLQSLVSSAYSARESFERGVRRTLQAVNLPTSEDVEELKRRLADLESTLDDISARLDRAGNGSSKPADG